MIKTYRADIKVEIDNEYKSIVYVAVAEINGIIYEGRGATQEEAIVNLMNTVYAAN